MLTRTGCVPQVTAFAAIPNRLDAAACCALLAAVVAARARRRAHMVLIAGLAVAAIAAVAGILDALLPHCTLYNVDSCIEPRARAVQEVWLGAHYDSKTEGLDHRQRAAAWAGATVLVGLAAAFGRARPRAGRWCGAAGFAVAAATAGAGRLARSPSHGIIDNATGVALITEIAADLHAQPLAHTRVRCVFWAAEELGAQGSRAFVRHAAVRPQAAVNLEGIGAGPGLGVPRWEWTGRSWAGPDAALRQQFQPDGAPAVVDLALPVVTDCGALRRAGIPALTLLGLGPGGQAPHGLHTSHDRRQAVDPAGLRNTREVLWKWLRNVDAVRGE